MNIVTMLCGAGSESSTVLQVKGIVSLLMSEVVLMRLFFLSYAAFTVLIVLLHFADVASSFTALFTHMCLIYLCGSQGTNISTHEVDW